MLSYRHIYHAGNHADILKHLVASQVCQHLVKKEAPFFYLDTHAGIGLYELASDQAQLNHEYDTEEMGDASRGGRGGMPRRGRRTSG